MELYKLVGTWDRILQDIFDNKEVISNLNTINNLYRRGPTKIYPEQADVFAAFKECPYNKLSVVILLQDPYHDGSATGIATANTIDTKKLSPSLQVMKDTICREIYKGEDFNFDPTLLSWERQGVLMLNTALTVETNHPQSHQIYWTKFTELALRRLSELNSGIIYCLWGKHADTYDIYINSLSNTILRCVHPVYASYRGVPWECRHFIEINKYLKDFNNTTIIW
jgi:uracil-DNA glycosylase